MRISPRSGAAGSGIVRLWRFALATLALGSTWAAASEPKPCPIIDAIAPLSVVASRTAGEPEATQIAAYKQALIEPHPGLYAEGVLGLKQGPVMDQLILASLAQARKAPNREALKARVRQQVAATSQAFHQVFPDFRCKHSLDQLAHLKGTKLHDEIGNALRVLASSGAEAGPTS